ncbi:MAG: YafY family transcriptional regulator [Acidobacteria bacterium]|nr:YafY family transcriptional regulator [Acidobacteriota bacterium]
MRRADRLFELLLWLRRNRAVTAAELARRVEVSERTIYRDIGDLMACGVPIDGEAGVGYRLHPGFELPPLMFTKEELDALRTGARIVESWADPRMARAAQSALARIEAVLPEKARAAQRETPVYAPGYFIDPVLRERFGVLREASEQLRVVELLYHDAAGQGTRRSVQPLGLFYWGASWTLAAWCELREGFRTFRLDRIAELRVTDRLFPREPGRDLASYIATVSEE